MDNANTENRSSDSHFVGHEPCPAEGCGSSDALARYSDGHAFCFKCEHYEPADGEAPVEVKRSSSLLHDLEFQSLHARGITEETCVKWGYGIGTMSSGAKCQVAQYRDRRGRVVAQKCRFPDKSFTILGDSKQMGLFGQHLWQEGGKMIVVTEGEVDALSLSQVQDNRWPVVSIPNGAQSAARALSENIDFLSTFDKVILMFDSDEEGRKAAQECAELFTPGRVAIASLPLKDPNEMLKAGRAKELIQAMWQAPVYRPDGIVVGEEMLETILTFDEKDSVPYPWESLNELTHGIRRGELVVVTAGTGVGKSAVCREVAYSLLKEGTKIGYIALEESVRHTGLCLIGLELNKRVELHHIFQETSPDSLKEGFAATLGTGNIVMYDHFGSLDPERLMNKIRQMARGFKCDFIFLDHISIAISEFEGGDERRRIDAMMTKLKNLTQELNIGIIAVSHLKRPDGRPLEEGGRVSLSLLRGSGAIGQLTNIAIGAERDQQGPHPNITTLRVLKNRYTGQTGIAGYLSYDSETGRLTPTDKPPVAEEIKDEYGF